MIPPRFHALAPSASPASCSAEPALSTSSGLSPAAARNFGGRWSAAGVVVEQARDFSEDDEVAVPPCVVEHFGWFGHRLFPSLGVLVVTATNTLTAASTDPAVFAEMLLGRPLWPHQLALARSAARYRVTCSGRQVGKSTLLAVLALHEAATRRNVRVMLVSAGEVASRRLLEECGTLANGSLLLRGSVLDESRSVLGLSNGSQILSVPASQRQIRGPAVDLLILDEAGFIDPEIWRAAEPTIIARPGSRVILSSSPWGAPDHFFRALWRRGMDSPDAQVASWHWPSSVSPMVDLALLEEIRRREPPLYFAREYLAEWSDEAGSYFPAAELASAVADYEMLPPERARGDLVVAGLDFGFSVDANALVLVGVLDDGSLNDERHPDERVFFVPWLEAHYRMPYTQFSDRVVDLGDTSDPRRGYTIRHCLAELNGPGMPVVQAMRSAVRDRWYHRFAVLGVNTTAQYKENGFGMLRLLIQRGRLVLPRHPELLAQLNALEYTASESGHLRIAVPDRLGHDDLAMALMQAGAALDARRQRLDWPAQRSSGDVLTTGAGTRTYSRPRCRDDRRAFRTPRGGDARDDF